MRMTKEVKDYAIREFGLRAQKARENALKPRQNLEESIKERANAILKEANDALEALRKEYKGTHTIDLDRRWKSESKPYSIYATIETKEPFQFSTPDKVKFLAELSTGESLEDLSKLLDKYFN
jgi:2-oxoglutarate dehydrogenase complex dehydrogenase (E1) component-like enzyme